VGVAGRRHAGWLTVEFKPIFTEELPKRPARSSPSYDVIEWRLGGAGVWDVLAMPVGDQIDGTTLAAVARIEHRLREDVRTVDDAGQKPACASRR